VLLLVYFYIAQELFDCHIVSKAMTVCYSLSEGGQEGSFVTVIDGELSELREE